MNGEPRISLIFCNMRKLQPIEMWQLVVNILYYFYLFTFFFSDLRRRRDLQIGTQLICTITTWLLLASCMPTAFVWCLIVWKIFFINEQRPRRLQPQRQQQQQRATANIYFSLFLRTGLKKVHRVLSARRSFYHFASTMTFSHKLTHTQIRHRRTQSGDFIFDYCTTFPD